MRLVGSAESKRISGPRHFATHLQAREPRLIADVTRVKLVGRNIDPHVILRFVGLRSGQEGGRTLTMTASGIVAIGRAMIVRQAMKAIEVVPGKRERLQGGWQV